MGPAKGSQIATKITVKAYKDEQHHEDPSPSSKAKLKKRKMSDLGPKWNKDELLCFYDAYRRHGKNWEKVSTAVGSKSSDMVEALYNVHQTFLSLPEREGTAMGFIALTTGHHYVLDEFPNHKESHRTVRTSRAQNRGEAAQQKEKESPHPSHSYHVKKVLGSSSSSRKRCCGGLIRDIPSHPFSRRTPRVPVTVSADINATDDTTPKIKNTVSTKMVNEEINNDGSMLALNGCSPDGSSGITEASRVVQDRTLLETKGTGDIETSQTQQHLKKRGIEPSMDKDRIDKVGLEHKTMTDARDGNNIADYQGLAESFSADEMLVLDVLESLVTVTSKASQPMITSGTLGKNTSVLSHKSEEGPSTVGQSKKGKKRVSECNASKTAKKRRKKLLDEEILVEEQNTSANNLSLPEACQVDTTEHLPSLNSGSERGGIDLPESTASISAEVCPDVPVEIKPEINVSRRSKRKSIIQCRTKYVSCNTGADNLQVRKLLHCLSSGSLRRWCTYEWFYSAVDYPWFMNNEFVSYLNFAKLSHLSRLTRSEWSTIRSSLGKPRRFSDNFLEVEKEKLEDYRKNVRKYYAQLIDGYLDSLPADLAQPFSIGQWLIVRHPSTRELCDGKVVAMEQDCYKVQFDNPDLGFGVVKDTDCMPVNWLDNLPDDLKNKSSASNYAHDRLYIQHIPKHTQKEAWEHGIISEQSKNQQITSDDGLKVESAVYSEKLPKKSSTGRFAPLHSLQSADDIVQSSGRSNTNTDHNDELDSYITAFVESSVSQAKQMIGQVTQEISENGNNSREEETCTSNQATNHTNQFANSALDGAPLPSDLMSICVATVLAIQQLSESRLPPANVVGVLERISCMLRPSCSENLTIYKDIESSLGIIKKQLLALMPPTSGNGTGFAITNCDFGHFYESTC